MSAILKAVGGNEFLSVQLQTHPLINNRSLYLITFRELPKTVMKERFLSTMQTTPTAFVQLPMIRNIHRRIAANTSP